MTRKATKENTLRHGHTHTHTHINENNSLVPYTLTHTHADRQHFSAGQPLAHMQHGPGPRRVWVAPTVLALGHRKKRAHAPCFMPIKNQQQKIVVAIQKLFVIFFCCVPASHLKNEAQPSATCGPAAAATTTAQSHPPITTNVPPK